MSKSIIVAGSEGLLGKELCSFLEKEGNQIIRCDLSLGHDLTDEEFVKKFFFDNKADYLINLYAINPHVDKTGFVTVASNKVSTNLFDISLESFNQYLQTNVLSLFSVCREYARNNAHGAIINFSSIYGLVTPDPSMYQKNQEKHIGYCVSKGAVVQMTRYLAAHLGPNIRVNCVAPGGVKFNPSDEHGEKFINIYSSKTALKRMMNVDELNGIIEYLCSDKSSYTTGAVFNIDAGWTIW